ncbi:ATP-binding cassette domain-containing protein [Roseibacterium beibuensis]|uniref:cell division ATP-binding protein FtsE n=1 Tax=[Roseibacterium] beibuensis TaxID=1193142 RepID=UPI00217E35D6|nr:ATP-binding cassette domain-containing protein [Roseibacterium beibuensis]MCS6626210.1 ATP-binding cassette domain-containing protein [Roseibacterium beibuensis]
MPVQPRRAALTDPATDTARLSGVSFGYADGPDVLRDVNLILRAGSFHFLTGPSGAGKSTLLKLLTLAKRPTAGQLDLFGEAAGAPPRSALPGFRRRMGVVFQDFRLLDHLSAFDNVALPLRLAGAKRESWAADVEEMLDWVGLGDRMDDRPPTLSGGEKQRLAIARAVVTRPELILADEPTGSVDSAMGERLLKLFQSLNRLGTTVLIASHDEALAAASGAAVLRLDGGRLSGDRA